MTLGAYYEKFNTRVAIADYAGCAFVTESLMDNEIEIVFPGTSGFNALQANKKAKVEKAARDKYLAILYKYKGGHETVPK